MKLIIDVPDDMYYAIEHRYWSVVNEAVLLSYVAKGTPLDKLRAEIHANAEMHEDGDYYLRDEWIDEIFDKYRNEVNE